MQLKPTHSNKNKEGSLCRGVEKLGCPWSFPRNHQPVYIAEGISSMLLVQFIPPLGSFVGCSSRAGKSSRQSSGVENPETDPNASGVFARFTRISCR